MGLEYRPWDSLLLRATYATAFRAPDMEYLFAKDSGLEESVTDWYQCRSTPPTTPIDQCPNSWGEYVFALNSGSNALKSVTSQSFGYGLVFSPTDRFNLKLDYQHIVIDNEIQPLDSNALLFTEANCRIGMTPGGQSVDVNSPTCLDAIARVVRYPANYPVTAVANQIEEVLVGPVNIASESLDGIQSSADYKFDIGRYGNLDLAANYYIELHHRMKNKPGDPEIDLLHDFNSTEFKSNAAATATWTIGHWATSLHAQYHGSSVTADQSSTIGSFMTWNGSLRYQIPSRGAYIQLAANNLLDRHPPPDGGAGWPFYNTVNFDGFGRSVFLEFGMHFGGGEAKP
jgi:iron complex outermembrane receptor protein